VQIDIEISRFSDFNGGFLLSNNAPLELPVGEMKSVDYWRWSIRIALATAITSCGI
jgi:hypothetical protein